MESGQQEVPVRGVINLAREFGLSVDEVLGLRPDGITVLEPSSADAAHSERLRLVEELNDDDRAVLHKLIDTFVSKHRFKIFVQENIETL